MSGIWALLLLVLVIGAVAFFAWERQRFAKAQMLGELGRLHATNVVVSPDLFDFDRDTMTFDVEYTTRDGRRHANRCKVATSPGADGSVYWERNLEGAS